MKKVALITGVSSGIGREIAIQVAKQGYTVYGMARRIEMMEDLKPLGIIPIKMDVTSKDQIQKAVQQILDVENRIDVLINNAGYGFYEALETGDIQQGKDLYEVNVFGLIQMTQAVLPTMRAQNQGKIINISSVVGKVAFPYMGWYSSSKFAVEGLSDALRIELAPFNISVSIIEPGRVVSEFGQTALNHSDINSDSPYQQQKMAFQYLIENNPIPADKPSSISKAVISILKSSKPKTRYAPNLDAKISIFAKKIFGDKIIDWAIALGLKKIKK